MTKDLIHKSERPSKVTLYCRCCLNVVQEITAPLCTCDRRKINTSTKEELEMSTMVAQDKRGQVRQS
jgi:hypothetical protein